MFGFFKKKTELKKTEPQPQRVRRFTAAQRNRLIDWVVSYNKINRDLKTDYREMSLRARDLSVNNEFVVGYIKNMIRNVIGASGFTLQCLASDLETRAKIERAWREYNSRAYGYLTIDERLGGAELDAFILRTLIVYGEVFIRRVFDPSSKFGIRYEVLDPLDIDPLFNVEPAGKQKRITMGIQFDERGRETGYYFRRTIADCYQSGDREFISADQMIHIFRKELPDQARGFSWLAGIIMNLAQLDAYKEAELVHARIQSCVMGVWEWNGTSAGTDLLDESDDEGKFQRTIEAGSFPVAPKGYSAKFLQNTSPNGQFASFWKSVLRSIANALGISYNKAAGDYESVNYSSLREATLEDRASFEEVQQFLISNWKMPQYKHFIAALSVNGTLSSVEKTDAADVRFFGRRFPWVDPQKELSAKQLEYQMYLTDPITELEQRGIDPDDVIARWQDWNKRLAAHGLAFNITPNNQPDQEEPDPAEEESNSL